MQDLIDVFKLIDEINKIVFERIEYELPIYNNKFTIFLSNKVVVSDFEHDSQIVLSYRDHLSGRNEPAETIYWWEILETINALYYLRIVICGAHSTCWSPLCC